MAARAGKTSQETQLKPPSSTSPGDLPSLDRLFPPSDDRHHPKALGPPRPPRGHRGRKEKSLGLWSPELQALLRSGPTGEPSLLGWPPFRSGPTGMPGTIATRVQASATRVTPPTGQEPLAGQELTSVDWSTNTIPGFQDAGPRSDRLFDPPLGEPTHLGHLRLHLRIWQNMWCFRMEIMAPQALVCRGSVGRENRIGQLIQASQNDATEGSLAQMVLLICFLYVPCFLQCVLVPSRSCIVR